MELGPTSEFLHSRCGSQVGGLKFDLLITVGDEARPLAAGAKMAGMPSESLIHCPSPEEAGQLLCKLVQAEDVVLLKASRAVHLERAWDRIRPVGPSCESSCGT